MIEIDIPGRATLKLEHLVLDVNGTIARDGRLTLGVAPRLRDLKHQITIHMLTADTHGKQASIDSMLEMKATIITGGGDEKADFVKKLGAQSVVAIGNGANDAAMCKAAELGIAVLGQEGLAVALLHEVDVLARDIVTALDLLLFPARLRATLRA
jgi:P-type E1-E2 ATPase